MGRDYGSIPGGAVAPRVAAVAMLAQGAALLLAPSRAYRSDTYTVAFTLLDQRWWGAAFLAVGVAYLLWRTPVTFGALLFVLVSWPLALFAARVTGDAESPMPGLWPATLAAIVVISGARWGVGARR